MDSSDNSGADAPYYLAFARVKGIGPVRLRALLGYFGSLRRAWGADAFELASSGLDNKSAAALIEARTRVRPDAELESLAKAGVTALTWAQPEYPRLLREVADPPPALFIKGQLLPSDEVAVAIVGTRRPTAYGREVAEMLAAELAKRNITVVSGMARGIDGCAHAAAIKAGGRTIAVLGCGVDVVYPPEHRHLAGQIQEHGALVSDYPLGTGPDAVNFPPRNRIISGLSLGVVVVEADERSGALITTEFAAEQGRDVFAVPGNILNRSSRGPNRLIQQGAKVVLDIDSILEELNLGAAPVQPGLGLDLEELDEAAAGQSDLERNILAKLSREPVRVDELVRALQLPAESVTAALSIMEIRGLVRRPDGQSVTRAR